MRTLRLTVIIFTAPWESEDYKMNGRLVLWISYLGFEVVTLMLECTGTVKGLSGSQWADEGLINWSRRDLPASLPSQQTAGFLFFGWNVFEMEMEQTFCCPSFCLFSELPPTQCISVSFSYVLISVILWLYRDWHYLLLSLSVCSITLLLQFKKVLISDHRFLTISPSFISQVPAHVYLQDC